jgi:hypothetical protein
LKTMGNGQSTINQQITYLISAWWWASKQYERLNRLINQSFVSFCGWRWPGWRMGGAEAVNSRDFSLLARSISHPNHRICGAHRWWSTSQTLYRCETTVRWASVQFDGGFGHGRPAKPSIEGGGGRFSTILAIGGVRLKPRAGLRQNPWNCAWVLVRCMHSFNGKVCNPPLGMQIVSPRAVPVLTLFN